MANEQQGAVKEVKPRPIHKGPLFRFRMRNHMGQAKGTHIQIDPDTGLRRKYRGDEIIKSPVRLDKKFGSKFLRVDDGIDEEEELHLKKTAPATEGTNGLTEELSEMTVAELRAYAATEEIDVSDCSKKDELVNTIQAALDQR